MSNGAAYSAVHVLKNLLQNFHATCMSSKIQIHNDNFLIDYCSTLSAVSENGNYSTLAVFSCSVLSAEK